MAVTERQATLTQVFSYGIVYLHFYEIKIINYIPVSYHYSILLLHIVFIMYNIKDRLMRFSTDDWFPIAGCGYRHNQGPCTCNTIRALREGEFLPKSNNNLCWMLGNLFKKFAGFTSNHTFQCEILSGPVVSKVWYLIKGCHLYVGSTPISCNGEDLSQYDLGC